MSTPAPLTTPDAVFVECVRLLRKALDKQHHVAFDEAASTSADAVKTLIARYGQSIAESASAKKRLTLHARIKAVFPLLPDEPAKDAKAQWARTEAGVVAINAWMVHTFEGLELKKASKARYYAIPEDAPKRTTTTGGTADWTMQTIISAVWNKLTDDERTLHEASFVKAKNAYTSTLAKWKTDPKNRATYSKIKGDIQEWERTHLGAPKSPRSAMQLYMADRKDKELPVPRAKDAKQKLFDALSATKQAAYTTRAKELLADSIFDMEEFLERNNNFAAIPEWYRAHKSGATTEQVTAALEAQSMEEDTDEEVVPKKPARSTATRSVVRASARGSARETIEEEDDEMVPASAGKKVQASALVSDDEEE